MTMFTCMSLLTRVNYLRTGLHNINSGLQRYAIRVLKQCGRHRHYFDYKILHMTWNCDVLNDKWGTPCQVYYNSFYRDYMYIVGVFFLIL